MEEVTFTYKDYRDGRNKKRHDAARRGVPTAFLHAHSSSWIPEDPSLWFVIQPGNAAAENAVNENGCVYGEKGKAPIVSSPGEQMINTSKLAPERPGLAHPILCKMETEGTSTSLSFNKRNDIFKRLDAGVQFGGDINSK